MIRGQNRRGIDVDLNELVPGDDSMNLEEEHRHTRFIGNQQQRYRVRLLLKVRDWEVLKT